MKKYLSLACALALACIANATVYRPGLVQAKFQGKAEFFNNQNNTPVLVSNLLTQTTYTMDAALDFTYGALMADATVTSGYANPWSGNTFGWSSEYSVFAYEGEIFLHQGEEVVATGRFDDGSAVVVNGVTLFNMGGTSGYNGAPSKLGAFQAPTDGWYPINAWVWDWTGGKAVCGGYISGIQINLANHWADFTSATYWSKLADPGDGSFLRSVDPNTGYMTVGLASIDGADVKVSASFADVPYNAELHAYYGGSDAGADLGKWAGHVKIADIAAGDTAGALYTIPGGANQPNIRLCLYRLANDASGVVPCTSFYEVGDLMTFEQTAPTVDIVQTTRTMESLGFTVSVMGYGAGATSCDLHAVLSSDAEYTNVLDSFDKTSSEVSATTPYGLSAEGLTYATTYYVKVLATNDKGETRTIETTFETLPAPGCETTVGLEKAGSTLTSLIWSLSDFGEGSSYASVAVEYSAVPSFAGSTVQTIAESLDAAASSVRVVIRDLTPSQTYYVRLKTVNELGTVTYTPAFSVTTTQTESNRIWANTGTDMNDPASYVENLLPGSNDIIYFTEPVVTQPYLSDDLTAKGIYFGRYDGTRTDETGDPDGYVFTGAAGATLTLTGTGNSNYAMNSSTTAGHAEFNIPILLSGNSNPYFAANGIYLDFKAPIATSGEYAQDVSTMTDGKDRTHIGVLRFSAANPDFKPTKIHISSSTRVEMNHPEALVAVREIAAGHWGGTDYPYLRNTSGETIVMDNLLRFSGESYGLNSFTFEGSPIIMTNCEFAVSQRDSKTRYFNAAVSMKTVGGWDWSGATFTVAGTNMLETLNPFYEADGITSHIELRQGMFYPHALLQTVARAGRRFRISGENCNGSSVPFPTLGIDGNVRIPVSNLGGISFGADNAIRGGGFSSMGGEVSVTLTDTSDNKIELVDNVKTPEGSGYMAPYPWAFGNMSATGTICLENDISRSGNTDIYTWQGKTNVTARLKGKAKVLNGILSVRGSGTLAVEGGVEMTAGNLLRSLDTAGLLVNCDLTTDFDGKLYYNGNGWLGGTGKIKQFHFETANSALRGGEFGHGTLTVTGEGDDFKFAANCGIIVDITAEGTCGLLKFEGDLSKYSSNWSGHWLQLNVAEGAPAGRYKIMDWTAGTGNPTKMMTAAAYSENIRYDADKVESATLSVENGAMYLDFVPKSTENKPGIAVFVF